VDFTYWLECMLLALVRQANALVNRLLEMGEFSQLGVVVVDEMHMMGSAERGYLLEVREVVRNKSPHI